MKKFAIALAIASLAATPAFAGGWGGKRGYYKAPSASAYGGSHASGYAYGRGTVETGTYSDSYAKKAKNKASAGNSTGGFASFHGKGYAKLYSKSGSASRASTR